jgi:hypothetical protein
MRARRNVLLRVAQFVAKIGSLHLAIIGSVYFTADIGIMGAVSIAFFLHMYSMVMD